MDVIGVNITPTALKVHRRLARFNTLRLSFFVFFLCFYYVDMSCYVQHYLTASQISVILNATLLGNIICYVLLLF